LTPTFSGRRRGESQRKYTQPFYIEHLSLSLTAASAVLGGEANVYVKMGSTIALTCSINLYSTPPPDVVWFHGDQVREEEYRQREEEATSLLFCLIFHGEERPFWT